MEMPRCCSISMKSETACRCVLLPRTAPASSIAPAYSRSFSVSVVLPASGWEMMANVRRRPTSRASRSAVRVSSDEGGNVPIILQWAAGISGRVIVGDSVTRVLVVAATDRELAVGGGWLTLRCGVGPVEAAAITASAIARTAPHLILHVGIAGARRAAALSPPALVIGDESRYCDLSVPATLAPSVVQVPAHLVAA